MELTCNIALRFIVFITSVVRVFSEIPLVHDADFLNFIHSESFVVTYFAPRDCKVDLCDRYEKVLVNLQEDLVNILHADVVKLVGSELSRLYTPSDDPVYVFFRHGVPLLYVGDVEEELVFNTFLENKEPVVKELTDDNFEHLTQAGTGATTGDWFVMFYSNDCIECRNLQARLEAVGAKLKSRLNLARVNKGTTGTATARRFNVFHVPTFILFRRGKLYRYHIQKYDFASLVTFATEWYKNVPAEKVLLPETVFDRIVDATVKYLKLNPWLWQLGFASFGIGLFASLLMRFINKKKIETKAKTKKK